MDVKTGCASLLAAALIASPAMAQTTPTPPPDSKQVIPEKKGEALQSGRSESLSKKLHESDGVIKPKANVDPGMHAPTPKSPNSMPVIPPSATGGDNAK